MLEKHQHLEERYLSRNLDMVIAIVGCDIHVILLLAYIIMM